MSIGWGMTLTSAHVAIGLSQQVATWLSLPAS